MVKRAGWWVIAILGVLTGLRLFLAGITPLIPEEAYYWTYAQHPAWGYFDHPPMVAWVIWLGTKIAGDTELGVRLINILLFVGTSGLLFSVGRTWFGERVAGWAVALTALLPVFVGVGFVVTPDGALIFWWMVTLWALTGALKTGRVGYWMLAGAGLGAAMLSKYYAVILVPSLGLFLILSREHRGWLRRPHVWLAGAVAAVVFSPVIYWNATHEWASFLFQSTRTSGADPHRVKHLLLFWVYQLGELGVLGLPLMGLAAVRGVQRGWFGKDDRWNFAVAFSLPLFGLFAVASAKTQIHINWTAPVFLSLGLAAAAVLLEGIDADAELRNRRWRRWGIAAVAIWLGVFVFLHVNLAVGKPRSLAYTHAGGWQELAACVDVSCREVEKATGTKPFVIGADKYNIAAELGFYLGRPGDCVNLYAVGDSGLGYRFWTDLQRWTGQPAVIVSRDLKPAELESLTEHFERLGPSSILRQDLHGRTWRVRIGYGYRPDGRKP